MCGCEHSDSYNFEWSPPEETTSQWSAEKFRSLLELIRKLDCGALTIDEIESRLEWWWRGENRVLRKAMESNHRNQCERGRDYLINAVTGQTIPNRCKSWRDCQYCAWLYGRAVERLFGQVKRLRAFVVFTMSPEYGAPFKRDNLAKQAVAMRRLKERLFRRFGRRLSMLWTREHNTKSGGPGRLHLNVLWDENWVEQSWLSSIAEECGFGAIVYISRIRDDGLIVAGDGKGKRVARYTTKCLKYASKDLSSQTDWPKGTRRWGASRYARMQMTRPARNPDWFFSLEEMPRGFLPGDFGRYRRMRPDEMRARGIECICANFVACKCGAWQHAGYLRLPLSHAECLERDRAAPTDTA